MGDDDDVTATSGRTSRRRRNGDRAEAPARFHAKCRTLADAIAKTGTRLRIALTAETGAEPFLIHASYETDSDLAWQPGAFLRRGVSIDSRDLDARTGDGRQWTAEL